MTSAAAPNTDAVILVGGQGTRLRPLTLSAPKPMLPTAGLPFLTHLLARIREAGIKHVVLGTSFKAEVFEEHFADGSDLGLEIEYVTETEPLGTGGGIRNVLPSCARRMSWCSTVTCSVEPISVPCSTLTFAPRPT